jgi:uracil-DNA glycosylase family 4
MKGEFDKLRKDAISPSCKELYSKSYEAYLFDSVPPSIVNWEYYEKGKEVETILPDQEHGSSEEKQLDKKETIESLENFVKKEVEKESGKIITAVAKDIKNKDSQDRPIVKFSGGEVHIKEVSSDDGDIINLTFDCSPDRDSYHSLLYSCNKCGFKEKVNKVFSNLPSKDTSLEVLIIGDTPKLGEDDNYQLFSNDQDFLLDRMIQAMNFQSSETYKSLISKCSFVEDSSIEVEECYKNCLQNLYIEILLLKPKVVLALGAVSTRLLLGKREKLSQVHGSLFSKRIEDNFNNSVDFKVVPIFHPEFLLINPNMKMTTWEDLQGVMKFLGKTLPEVTK